MYRFEGQDTGNTSRHQIESRNFSDFKISRRLLLRVTVDLDAKTNTNRTVFTCCTQRYARNREMNFGSENEYQWTIQETESTMGCGINIFFNL